MPTQVELQKCYSQISLQAAPWSAAIQAEVAASEAKATGALSEVRALYEATKSEVEDLRRRASDVEKRSSGDKEWRLTRSKDMVPDIFTGKDEAWSKFKDSLTDYAEACNDGLKLQLDWTLTQKEEITQ